MRVLVAALLSLMATFARGEAPSPAYTVHVIPKGPPTALHKVWRPILDRLSSETGMRLELRVARDYATFETALAEGRPDFAFMNPYQMLLARRAQRYEPLVRDRANVKRGVVVVRNDSPAQDISGLKGAAVAFTTPTAFIGTLHLRAVFDAEGADIQPRYVGTHANVLRHVLLGKVAAGATNDVSLAKEPPEAKALVRTIYAGPELMSYPFAAHPRIPAEARERIADAFLRLAGDSAFTRLLEEAEIAKPIRANYASDYQPIERLRLERFAPDAGKAGGR